MKTHLTRTFLVLLTLLGSIQLSVAQFTASGNVVDDTGEPLVGVAVLVQGTTRGIFTDNEGAFSLEVPSSSATLMFSYIGFSTQEIEVTPENASMIVTMVQDIARLDEVIITGLASGVKRSNSGNAITSVNAEELTGKTNPQTLDYALFGEIARCANVCQ